MGSDSRGTAVGDKGPQRHPGLLVLCSERVWAAIGLVWGARCCLSSYKVLCRARLLQAQVILPLVTPPLVLWGCLPSVTATPVMFWSLNMLVVDIEIPPLPLSQCCTQKRWGGLGKESQNSSTGSMYHWLWRLLSVLFFNLFSFWIYLLYASCSTVWHSSVLACSLHYLRKHIYLLFVIYRPGCIKIFLGHTWIFQVWTTESEMEAEMNFCTFFFFCNRKGQGASFRGQY